MTVIRINSLWFYNCGTIARGRYAVHRIIAVEGAGWEAVITTWSVDGLCNAADDMGWSWLGTAREFAAQFKPSALKPK